MAEGNYLLRVWGADEDRVCALRPPDAKERDDDGPYCWWFPDEVTREAFIQSWAHLINVVRDRVDPKTDWAGELIDTHACTWVDVVLSYEGRQITVSRSFGFGYPAHSAEYMWTDGNYSCDCNKRLFIWRQDGLSEDNIDQQDNPCGDTIPLVSLIVRKVPG